MKNLPKCLITLTLLICFSDLFGQADWNTGGNGVNSTEFFGATSGSTIPISFQHLANGSQSRFEWYTHEAEQSFQHFNKTKQSIQFHKNLLF